MQFLFLFLAIIALITPSWALGCYLDVQSVTDPALFWTIGTVGGILPMLPIILAR